MKKIVSIMIIFLFCISPVSSFAVEPTVNDKDEISVALSKISGENKQKKIEKFLLEPFYGKVGTENVQSEKVQNSLLNKINSLGELSEKDLDKKIAESLKDTINTCMQDPNIAFTENAIQLVEEYCPEDIVQVKSKIGPLTGYIDTNQTSAYEWQQYEDTLYYHHYGGGGLFLFTISTFLDWGTDGNADITYLYSYPDYELGLLAIIGFLDWLNNDTYLHPNYSQVYVKGMFNDINSNRYFPYIDAVLLYTGEIEYEVGLD